MSKNRITGTKIDWNDLLSRVPKQQKKEMSDFKRRFDHHLKKLRSIPVEPPEIHWECYKSQLGPKHINWINELQSKYNQYKVPFPIDNYTKKIDDMEPELIKNVKQYKEQSNKNIEILQTELNRITQLIPYEQMTQEEFMEAHPELALDFKNKPTFWPHTPEEQLDFVPPSKLPTDTIDKK